MEAVRGAHLSSSGAIVECVPNFSEGRDRAKVNAIVDAIAAVAGVSVLDVNFDVDHNRSVVTFAGSPGSVRDGAVAGIGRAVELIDLRAQSGVHPRLGAADVVPFVQVAGATLEECARIAVSAGNEIWRRFQVPVYLYEAAARRPDRVNLANVRRGQYEVLREEIATEGRRAPDIGEPRLHPTAGAVVVGARKFLIAYNIDLATSDIAVARAIARRIRHSSGGFEYVKALGLYLPSRGCAQVSMNLVDFEKIPVRDLLESIESAAREHGTFIARREIIGMIPRAAWQMAPDFYEGCVNFDRKLIVEERLGL